MAASLSAYSQKTISNISTNRWTVEKANKWYDNHDWIVGCNYVPANAINQIEMWQKDTFSPKLIDKELAWAEEIGFNTLRVFLHYLPWKEDTAGYYQRFDQFLTICEKHNISVAIVFFDDVWHPIPKSGKQPEPIKGIHNSGWVQCPGKEILQNLPMYEESLKAYVQQTIQRYKQDERVLIWDLYNEPGNKNNASYGDIELKKKKEFSLALLKKVFQWAREINPDQPITSGIWTAGNVQPKNFSKIDKFCFEHSDIISFHTYSNKKRSQKLIRTLKASKRPLICTEYMARTAGSTFEGILPLFKKHNVAAYNWGFVAGKSNTIYPWKSWENPFDTEPEIWFHDIFRQDGTPFSEKEINLIKELTGKAD
ncbi:MAG: 1,4-beta-xylanase [Bacteroidetes bacterium]|nr:MAG: 1,4-beta-xylanase [Bacteroidota bacterium]